MILALDLATHAGWCLGGPDSPAPKFGTLVLPGTSDLQLDRSLVVLHDWLDPLCRISGVKIVLIEAPWMAPGRDEDNVAAGFYLAGAARLAAMHAGALPVLQNVKTVRATFIGNGNLKRDVAKAAAMAQCKRLGWSPRNLDEADAGALWYWGMVTTYPKWAPRRAA